MLGIIFLPGTKILCVGDIYFSSIEKIFSANHSGRDMSVFFGCDMICFHSKKLKMIQK